MSLRLGLLLAAGVLAALAAWRLADLVATARVSKATESFNQENRDAADSVAEARQRVRACHAGGGVWDRATGKCLRAVPGAGK